MATAHCGRFQKPDDGLSAASSALRAIRPNRRGARLAVPLRACWTVVLLGLFLLLPSGRVQAYSQFQQFSQKHSGRNTDCSMCHRNHEGPDGPRPGQIGSLTAEQKALYEQEQEAFDPGQDVDSPLLNEFGNHMVKVLGRLQIIELAKAPEKMPAALGFESDLDHDGIPDAQEFLDGTDPLDAQSGAPWKLLGRNLKRNGFHLAMTLLVTAFGIYGLNHLLSGFARVTDAAKERHKAALHD